MGLLDKVKNMFIEEVEEEDEPIKKEVIQVEIPSPKPTIPEKTDKSLEVEETVSVKREEKFVFPVYFDDKDFEKIEKEEVKPELVATSKREAYGIKKEEKPEKKVFKPTPIISPVYGVLDKNYSKDDITSKKRPSKIEYRSSSDKVDIDDVRKKAYGTLEDDLENNLFEKTSILFNDEVDNQNEDIIDIFEEPRHQQKEDVDLIEDFDVQDELTDTDNMIEDELNKTYEEDKEESSYVDELNDSDLFNLIDSMYEKKDDE